MTSATQEFAPSALRPPGLQALALRISGGGLDGRVVRLASPKCTVGSGPRCTLRLLGPGIHPLHCLIVRVPGRSYVRRWSPETRLNGRAFADAALRTGDRLRVGPLELEVLSEDMERPVGEDPPAMESRPVHLGPTGHGSENAPPLSRAAGADAEGLRDQIAGLRKRARSLVQALRENRRQQQELESRVTASMTAQEEAQERIGRVTEEAGQATHRARALQARVEVLERERARLTQQNERTQQELREVREAARHASDAGEADQLNEQEDRSGADAQLQGRIDELWAELNAHKERERALIKQLKLSKGREAGLQRRVQDSSANAQLHSDVEAKLAELQREKSEIADLRRQLQEDRDRFAALREAWQMEQQSLGVAAAACGSGPGGMHSERSSGDEADAPAARVGAPVPFLEKYAPQLLQAEHADASPSPETQDASGTCGDGDNSLAEYMSKLMQRVRGEDTPATPAPRQPEPHSAPPGISPSKSTPDPPTSTEPSPPPGPFRLQDIKRTGTLPERSGNFAAMRELANQSAHSAISNYQVRRILRDGVARLLVGAICLASGSMTVYLAPGLQSAATVGGAAGLVLAAYFFARGTRTLRAGFGPGGEPRSGTGSSESTAPPGVATLPPTSGPDSTHQVQQESAGPSP